MARLTHLTCYDELVPFGGGGGYQTIPFFQTYASPKHLGLSTSQSRGAARRGLYIYIISFLRYPPILFISHVFSAFLLRGLDWKPKGGGGCIGYRATVSGAIKRQAALS